MTMRATTRRRGSTALLAMLFMTLFAALAVGFFGTVGMSVQVAGNEQRTNRAQFASDSGMQFMKYHLATLGIPPSTPTTALFGRVYDRLGAKLNDFPNMPAGAPDIDLADGGTLISIPGGANNWIDLDDEGSAFRAEVRKMAAGEKIEVRVYGRFGETGADGSGRVVKLEYANFPNPAAIFNYGVASESAISMNGNVTIQGTEGNEHMGSVLSAHTLTATPLTMTGGPLISGHVSFVRTDAAPVISSRASIADLSPGEEGFNDVIHRGVPRPEFPTIDTSEFERYVPAAGTTGPSVIRTSNPSGTYFKNIRIRAGANPTFNNHTVIQGVIWIEQPNEVKFGGGVTIQGVVVTPTDGFNNPNTDLEDNFVSFTGGATFKAIETLPATSDFPESMRQLTGSALLVPGFKATFGGNFNTIAGSIIASQMTFHGTAGGIVKGSVINLRDSALEMSGTADIVIESQGTGNHPAGVRFGSHYSPLPHTYEELAQ